VVALFAHDGQQAYSAAVLHGHLQQGCGEVNQEGGLNDKHTLSQTARQLVTS